MDLISVIVPVYNVEKYLDRCISSIVNQTYTNLQIVLVDDGSPDNCPEMCEDWSRKDSRIQVIHKSNGGLSDARNAGLEVAAGKYIGFVDSDDWIEIDFYETLLQAIQENDAQIAASDVVFAYEHHEERHRKYDQRIFTSQQALETILKNEGFYATAWNKLYLADLLKDIRYPVGRIHEDEFVTYRLIDKAERLVLCQNTSYYYRQREESIMTTASIRHLDAVDAFLERLEYFRVNYPELYKRDKAVFCTLLVGLYRSTLINESEGEWEKVRQELRHYRRMIRYKPSEMSKYTMKQKIYIVGTAFSMDLFSRMKFKQIVK